MLKLQQELNMGVILITHDLGVVAEVCSRVLVMYLGQIVEECPVEILFANPLHPYTCGLIQSIPSMETNRHEELHVIEGTVPSLYQIPAGCHFAPRCPYADHQCELPPQLMPVDATHKVRCWHHAAISPGGRRLA
jgi:oligopeptide/dipeptide ABC transporter ATP-binding protein